jgi:hypothetical protein
MSNPAYGIRVNEEYALRFSELLSSEGFNALLQHEAERSFDVDDLTPHGWLWFLGWARSHDVNVNEDLLLHLTERWSNVFMQVLAIDVATQQAEGGSRSAITPLSEFEHPFLRRLLQHSVELPEIESGGYEDIPTTRAENTLVALLQIGRDITIEAARSLLHHSWRGQSKLRNYYMALRENLDAETQEIWDLRLGPLWQKEF